MCCVELTLKGVLSTRLGGKENLKMPVQKPVYHAMLVSQQGAHCEIRYSHSDIVDLEQVLIRFIIENVCACEGDG